MAYEQLTIPHPSPDFLFSVVTDPKLREGRSPSGKISMVADVNLASDVVSDIRRIEEFVLACDRKNIRPYSFVKMGFNGEDPAAKNSPGFYPTRMEFLPDFAQMGRRIKNGLDPREIFIRELVGRRLGRGKIQYVDYVWPTVKRGEVAPMDLLPHELAIKRMEGYTIRRLRIVLATTTEDPGSSIDTLVLNYLSDEGLYLRTGDGYNFEGHKDAADWFNGLRAS